MYVSGPRHTKVNITALPSKAPSPYPLGNQASVNRLPGSNLSTNLLTNFQHVLTCSFNV